MFNKKLKLEVGKLRDELDSLERRYTLDRMESPPKPEKPDLSAVYYHYDNGLEIGRSYMIRYFVPPDFDCLGFHAGFERPEQVTWTGECFKDASGDQISHKNVTAISEPIEFPEPQPIDNA